MPRVLRSHAALAGLACAVAVSACGAGDDKTKSSVSARATRSAPPPQTAPQAPPPRAMPMRTTQTIQAASGASNRPKTTLKVTVTRLLRGLHPNDFQFGGSRKGLRFVG